MVASLSLALAASGGVLPDAGNNHFIVACSLFESASEGGVKKGADGRPEAHDLNLLVGSSADADSNLQIVQSFDPDHLVGDEVFVKGFWSKPSFAALTGSIKDPKTHMLTAKSRGDSEYDALLTTVANRKKIFTGRCWMSNIANAEAEFEKLKVKDVSQ